MQPQRSPHKVDNEMPAYVIPTFLVRDHRFSDLRVKLSVPFKKPEAILPISKTQIPTLCFYTSIHPQINTKMNGVIQHVKGIFTTGEGTYINEHGEEVSGKLPREKLESPFHLLKRPTAQSESQFQAKRLLLSLQ